MSSARTVPHNKYNFRGFTLVELLVVVALVVLMSGALLPSFSQYMRNQSLRQNQEQIKSDLRSIQNKALTGALSENTISVSGVPTPVTHWGVRFVNGNRTYQFFIAVDDTAAECASSSSAERSQGSAVLGEGFDIKTATGCIFFSLQNGEATWTGMGNFVSVGPTGSVVEGNCRSVNYRSSGLIYSTTSGSCI